ncbi:hypothetical protein [Streptomyces capitiformicae]|uniref:Secreted protein n=1 Tax=Streptomyces capitiformicae TaxID=2014920 RepID=A0A919DR60_9ACTN|nr:hypothetical protein [Streptomyces capitiformicae]GHE73760.1 hypothetical protein GCM10017771_97410 [Streptomyces capitiformicae]
MRKNLKTLAVAVGGLALALGGSTVAVANPQGDVSAQVSCYDGASSFSKASGRHTTSVFRTSTRCNDINIKMSSGGRYVKVCFKLSSGSFDCQSDYKWAPSGSWKVIATDVRDFQEFVFFFDSTSSASGSYAA